MNRLFIFTLFFLYLLSPTLSLACRCLQPSLERSFHTADLVFLAKVLEETATNKQLRTFSARLIGEAYKGNPDEVITLTTARSSAACGIDFEIGKTYLLFGKKNASGEPPYLYNFCDGSRHFNPKNPQAHSGFSDAPASSISRILANLSTTNFIQKHGTGGVPLKSSVRGILRLNENQKPAALTVYAAPQESAQTMPELTSFEQLQLKEYTYEKSGALVYEKKDNWFKVKDKNNKNGWIHNNKSQYDFIPLSELLISRSTYLTPEWNGLIWPEPGAGIPFKLNVPKEQMIEVKRTQKIADSLWLYIKVHKGDPCTDGQTDTFQASGWIPAWNEHGNLTCWFWSRGC